MSRLGSLLIATVLAIAACGGSADSTTQAPTETTGTPSATTAAPPTPAAGSPLVISAVDFDTGMIVITNTGDSDYDLAGHQLCNRPTYVELPAETLAPGATIEIPTSDLGLSPESGEVGLYTARDFGNPEAIIRYVQWGEGDHGRSATAVEAGIWTSTTDFVPGGFPLYMTSETDPISPNDWAAL